MRSEDVDRRYSNQWVDLYKILGVSLDAEPEVIQAAYRALQKKYHPDRTGSDGARARELNEAYEVLSRPDLRRAYDELYRRSSRGDSSGSSSGYASSPHSSGRAEGVLNLNETSFDKSVYSSSVPFVVEFWADWCQPCVAMGSFLRDLSLEFGPRARMGKVKADENGGLAAKHHIKSIPAFLVFINGKEVHRIIGGREKAALKAELERYLR